MAVPAQAGKVKELGSGIAISPLRVSVSKPSPSVAHLDIRDYHSRGTALQECDNQAACHCTGTRQRDSLPILKGEKVATCVTHVVFSDFTIRMRFFFVFVSDLVTKFRLELKYLTSLSVNMDRDFCFAMSRHRNNIKTLQSHFTLHYI